MANATSLVNVYSSHPVCLISSSFDPYDSDRPDTVNPTWTVLATVNGLTALPTAGINGLIIWTVFSDENLRSVPFNVLLGELAVTDMLVGLVVQPVFSGVLGCLINDCYSPCQATVYVVSTMICSGATLVTLALACAERYLSIEHPNLYNRIVTGKRAQKVAVISWISNLVYLSSTFLLAQTNPSLAKGPFMLLAAVCTWVTAYCTFKVQKTAYRQQKAIDVQLQAATSNNAATDETEEQARRRKELKQVLTMTALVIMSILFIIPFIIVTVIQLATSQDDEFLYLSGPICVTLLNLQSLANPGILALRLSYIRNGIKKKLTFLMSLFSIGH